MYADCPTRPSPDKENRTPTELPGTPKKSANTIYAEHGWSYTSSGTAHTSSSGETSGGDSGWGWLKGPLDSIKNYGSAIVSQPDIFIGAAETVGSMALMGFGGDFAAGGSVVCLTGVGCILGAPAAAGGLALASVGAAGVADGIGRIDEGLGKAFREADSKSSGGGSGSQSQVEYGSTDLSKSVQLQRLIDKKKTGNYAAARLEGGEILVGRSSEGIHAEEDLIRQAGDRKIIDLYTEREPCAKKCSSLVKDMNVSYTWRWNGVDRAESTAQWKKAMQDLFNSP
jgi:hypothetical protein